ncbi:MAG: endolytic transglycosylase MltG [Acetobacteraceae bacterium]
MMYPKARGLPHPLTRSELAFNDGHNTYAQDGLPSGPICAPGYAVIMAVAHAPQGDELYFVAKGDESHVFSTTLKAHLAEVRRYHYHLPHPAKGTVPAE